MEFWVLLGKQRFGALPRGVEFNNGEPCTPGSEKGNERSQGQMWNVCIVINMLNSSKHWLSFYWSSLFRSCLYTSALLKVLIVTTSDMNIPHFIFSCFLIWQTKDLQRACVMHRVLIFPVLISNLGVGGVPEGAKQVSQLTTQIFWIDWSCQKDKWLLLLSNNPY